MSSRRVADVVGHADAVAGLRSTWTGDRMPGALLLHGPTGVGKRCLADALTARLLCAAPVDDDACGSCAQCVRLAAGTHPDTHTVERDADRRDIRIEQIRELGRWLVLRPLMAARKVALIDGAHHMNEAGQNALLKTLEEPPPGAVLVLTAVTASSVLPTVRSRCRRVRLGRLSSENVARVLEAHGLVSDRARALAPLGEGAPGRALAFEGEPAAAARSVMLQHLPGIAERPADELSKCAKQLAAGSSEAGLATAVAWYRDVIERALLGEHAELRNTAHAADVEAAAGRHPVVVRLRQLEAVCDTITDVERNANRVLALETMLLWLRALERDGAPGRASTPTWTSIP